MDKIIETLKERGYRITSSRLILIKYFYDNTSSNFTAEELQCNLRKLGNKINVMSLYNNLKILTNESIIKESVFKGKKVYELAESNHAHFYCKKCNNHIDIVFDDLYKFNKEIENKYGFTIEDTKTEFIGLCKDCKEETK